MWEYMKVWFCLCVHACVLTQVCKNQGLIKVSLSLSVLLYHVYFYFVLHYHLLKNKKENRLSFAVALIY